MYKEKFEKNKENDKKKKNIDNLIVKYIPARTNKKENWKEEEKKKDFEKEIRNAKNLSWGDNRFEKIYRK